MKISIGNFPAKSEAILRVHYFAQLPVEDLSYALRVPVNYIPRYMGDMKAYIENNAAYKGQKKV